MRQWRDVGIVDGGDALGVDLGRLGEPLAATVDVAERGDRVEVLRAAGDQLPEPRRRVVGPLQDVEAEARLDLGVALEPGGRRYEIVDLQRILAAVGAEEEVAQRHQRKVGARLEVARQMEVGRRQLGALVGADRSAEAIEHLGGPFHRVGDDRVRGDAGFERGEKRADDGMIGLLGDEGAETDDRVLALPRPREDARHRPRRREAPNRRH